MFTQKKHIMLFISALRKGGAERVIVTLAQHMEEKGYRVTIVTQYRADEEYTLPKGVERVFSEPNSAELKKSRVINFFVRYFKLRDIWKRYKPDCILSFIGKNNIMAILTTLFTGIPVVVSVRSDPAKEYNSKILRILAKTLFAKAEGVVVQTQEAIQFFPKYIQKKTVVLKNPLNSSFVRPRYLGKRDGNIVSVGRVDQNKNHEMILRAFAQIAKDFPETHVIVYGEGERREYLNNLAKELQLSERVLLPGAETSISDKIYRSSIFVLSSFFEGMPNALIEAMCLGVPSISTDCPCGGPRELIIDGVNGFLIPVGDVDALAQKLRELLNDKSKADLIGKNAAQLLERYCPEKVTEEWVEYLLSKIRK